MKTADTVFTLDESLGMGTFRELTENLDRLGDVARACGLDVFDTWELVPPSRTTVRGR